MTINDKIRDEKVHYDSYKDAAKISALSSGKIDKYEYLIGKEILASVQSRIKEQAKFTYSLLGNVLEKQTKTTEDQAEKQIKAAKNKVEKQLLDIDQKSIASLLRKKIRKKIKHMISKSLK